MEGLSDVARGWIESAGLTNDTSFTEHQNIACVLLLHSLCCWQRPVLPLRSPVVARSGKPIIAPVFFSSDRASGSKALAVTTGFAGKMGSSVGGLKEIVRTANTIAPAPEGSLDTLAQMADACHRGLYGARVLPVTFTADTVAAQFELFDRDTSGQGGDDLDLVMVNAAGQLVAYSATYGSDETIALAAPPAGNYRVCTLGYSTASGGTSCMRRAASAASFATKVSYRSSSAARRPSRMFFSSSTMRTVGFMG